MDVIILAGGLGTRLRSVVSDVPKCMAPICNKPFLHYLLTYLQQYDTHRVILSMGYKHEVIENWIKQQNLPFSFIYSVEDEPLGTGGAIKKAMEYVESNEVLILNGDTFFDINITAFLMAHRISNSTLSIALKRMQDFDRYGNVEIDYNNLITAFNEKEYCADDQINGGVYLLNKNLTLMDQLPLKFSFETEVLQSNVKNGSIHGFINDGYFIDIGIPEDFARANNEFDHFYKLNNLDLSGYDTLFLDRDGVINRLRPNDYVKSWSEFEFLPGVFEALAKFSKQFKRIFIITNQRGVGRGLMSEDDLNEIHRRMVAEIVKQGGRIDKIYYCTDVSNLHPNRKPNIGMALQAQHDYPEIDFSKSLMIGDSEGDMAFAKNSKMNSIKI